MITIKNEFLTANIKEEGAELKNLFSSEREYIWQSNPDFWTGACPTLFPICGSLKDNEFTLDGKTYSLQKHGFAKVSTFEVEKKSENSATFLLKSNAETLVSYPFEFEFRVIFTLEEKRLSVRYEIKNLSKETMYFSVGSHEGYAIEGAIEDYEVIFPEKETLYSHDLTGPLLKNSKTFMYRNNNVLNLKDTFFAENDTYIFRNIKSKSVTLKKKDGTHELRVEFGGFDSLMLWKKPEAEYLCIEVWNGAPDCANTDKNIKKKLDIQTVEPNQVYVRTHTVEIIK